MKNKEPMPKKKGKKVTPPMPKPGKSKGKKSC